MLVGEGAETFRALIGEAFLSVVVDSRGEGGYTGGEGSGGESRTSHSQTGQGGGLLMGSPGGETSLVEGQDGSDLSQGAWGGTGAGTSARETPPGYQGLNQSDLGRYPASETGCQEVVVEALESVASVGFLEKELGGDVRVQNEDGAGTKNVSVGHASPVRSCVVNGTVGGVTGYQSGDVVATDTGSGGVTAGLIRWADGVGVGHVVTKEEDAKDIEWRRVERIRREDRR